MIVVLDWLRDFVDLKENPEELSDMLTMLGMEAERCENSGEITNVVTARITKVINHPNADKLKLCEVFDGHDTHKVVCGAPNTHQGQITAFGRIGATLSGGFKIKPVTIRGEQSSGMLCSERELGISENHDGILDLPENTEPGQPITNLFPQPLQAIEFDITPNRPDCLSHLGIAREIALKTGRDLKIPEPEVGDSISDAVREYVVVNIDDPLGCPRYIAGIVKNIQVGPSPQWMVERLEAAGQRSINNVVDISNYVLLELGHPTHIFDYKFVPTKKVVIRRAGSNEKVTTLDDIERSITDQHLLITDGDAPIAIAGIMGGENSGVSEDTNTVLIESAYFDPITIRKGSKSLGLITESSRRFERGADPEGALRAFWRIVNLLEELAGGEQVPGIIDEYPTRITTPAITLRKSELDLLSGCEISAEFIEQTFTGLEIEWQRETNNSWTCTPPTFRPDLEREVDLIEELVRVFGYDNVPSLPAYTGLFSKDEQDVQSGIGNINKILTGLGFRQCYSNSLQSVNIAGSLGQQPVKLVNPLSEEMSHTRTSLFPGLIHTLQHNINNGNPDLQLYEHGQVFERKGSGFKGIREYMHLTGIAHGNMRTADIYHSLDQQFSFFTLKGVIELLFRRLHLNLLELSNSKHREPFTDCYLIQHDKINLGFFGLINPKYIDLIGAETGPLYGFEIDLTLLLESMRKQEATHIYRPISVYPTVERDLNFVLSEETEVDNVIKAIQKVGQDILKQVRPVDIFRHESIGAGCKSINFRFIFQHPDRTLEDKEVSSVINDIIAIFKRDFGAKLRS